MNTNLRYLFDPSKYVKVQVPEQKAFEEANAELMFAMEDLVIEGHKKLHTTILPLFKYEEMDKNLPAVAMISFIRQGFIRKYPQYCRKASRKRFRLITQNNEFIYLKKLDKKKRPSNIETHNNNLIIHQVTESKVDSLPNVFFGYTCSENYSVIKGVFAVCIRGKETLWVTNITDLRNQSGGSLVPLTPTAPTQLKPGVVKLKQNTKKE